MSLPSRIVANRFFFLLAVTAVSIPVLAQPAAPDSLPALEIAYRAGPLAIKGVSGNTVSWKTPASWGKDKDSMLVYVNESKKRQLFAHPRLKEAVPANTETVEVSLPRKGALTIQAAQGGVSVSKLEGDLWAETEKGAITLEEVKGSLYGYTAEGTVTVKASQVSGTVGTGKGDVLIENVEGQVQGFSKEGQVLTRYTNSYLQGKTSPLVLALEATNLEVESLVEGGELRVQKGNILVQEAPKGVSAWAASGDIVLEKVKGKVSASTRKGNLSCSLTAPVTQDVELLTEEGNLTISVPQSFQGKLVIEQEQNDANRGNYQLESELALGTLQPQTLPGPQGQTLAVITQLEKSLGNSSTVIRIRVVNGNLTIRKH